MERDEIPEDNNDRDGLPNYANRQQNRGDNNFNNGNFENNNNYENGVFGNNYDNNFGNEQFGDFNDNNNFNNDNFDDNDENNGELNIKYKDVMASRNFEDKNNIKTKPPNKIDPLISPYHNSQEHMTSQNNDKQIYNQQNRQNYNQQNHNQQNYNQNNRQNYNQNNSQPNRQNYNQQQQSKQNYNPSNPNYNTNHTNNPYLNGNREVLSPLYNDDTIKEEMVNLDSEQLDAFITKMKNKIYIHMNVSSFDPYCLQTLSSSELKELINKISLDLSGIDNISPSKYQMQPNIDYDTKQSNTKQIKNYNVDDGESKDLHQNKYEDILIRSNDYDEPDNFSDYMVEFKQPYHNVTSFQLLNLKLPPISNVITKDNSNIKILLNDDEIQKDVPPNMYDLGNLLKLLNVYLAPHFNVVETNNHIKIQNITNTKFDLENNDKSVFRMLGFKKSKYLDKSSYISEEEPLLGSNKEVFLFIGGIKDDEAIFKFYSLENPNNLCPLTITLDEPIDILSDIIISFKYENNIESKKNVNFYGKPHELLIRLGQ